MDGSVKYDGWTQESDRYISDCHEQSGSIQKKNLSSMEAMNINRNNSNE